ncbi:MAG TPA: SCP2 sterol-binding domain-containing protein [Burkholderiaceae bacterium]|nr:SCP2 sterol-binding domain-containing protein [Burkholderiaceae bacterium]
MDLNACTESLRTKVGDSSGLDATLKFDCGADGVIYIDGKSVPNSVTNANRDADCTISMTLENLTAMLSGELQPTVAFMTGKLTVSGDMSVALKLQRIF